MASNTSGATSAGACADLRARVRGIVLESGFDRVGFAAAGIANGADRLARWLERGFHGELNYVERSLEKRVDPRRVLPGAKTVIATAVHYRSAGPGGAAPGDGGAPAPVEQAAIASYARGTDYHRVLESRLSAVCDALRESHPASYRYYVDTGPVLERDWAEQAGIGWIGKNACAIDAERGSYFFIGVILTTLEIEPDPPAVNHCGTCRLCLDACPTGALVAPYELDSRLCISYLTIEHRGELPAALEPHLSNLVFGCDICQDVCPFNGRDALTGDAALAAREENRAPALDELADLDEAGFRRRFPRSAVRRAKHEGFLRNVIVALGNAKGPRAAETLERVASRGDVSANPVLAGTLERARRRIHP